MIGHCHLFSAPMEETSKTWFLEYYGFSCRNPEFWIELHEYPRQIAGTQMVLDGKIARLILVNCSCLPCWQLRRHSQHTSLSLSLPPGTLSLRRRNRRCLQWMMFPHVHFEYVIACNYLWLKHGWTQVCDIAL